MRAKNLGIIGLGVAGKALYDNAPLAGYESVYVYDSKSEQNTLSAQTEIDVLCLSAGIDINKCQDQQLLSIYQNAMKQGIPIVNDIELYYMHFSPRTIAVTGSYGKSTVVTMIHKLLLEKGVKNELRGNIGVAIWSKPLEVDCLVVEVSNYQLERLQSLKAEVGVITNIFPQHLDRYNGSFEQYKKIKEHLFDLSEVKICVKNDLIYDHDVELHAPANSRVLDATLAARAVARFLKQDVNEKDIDFLLGIRLNHRCELFYADEKRIYINDSKATAVQPVIEAIKNAPEGKKVLICGGKFEECMIDQWKLLVPYLEKVDGLILFGESALHILNLLKTEVVEQSKSEKILQTAKVYQKFVDMICGVQQYELTEKTIFLLSPGCQSFDEFKNFEERGECYKKLILAKHSLNC